MQVEIGSQDSERGTSCHDDGRDFGFPDSVAPAQPHQQSSVRSSTDGPLPACSAANGASAAYCSSLLRTYVDVKLSEPPGASHGEIQALSARLAAALPAALAAAKLGAAWRCTRAAPAGFAISSSALGVSSSAAAAAAARLLSHATRTVTHAAGLCGTFQLVFEVVQATAPAPATVDAVAVAAIGAALPAVLLEAAAEQQQQQVEAVEEALRHALAAALLPGWGIKSVQLNPQVQAQQQQQQSMQDQVVAALAAAAQGLALRPAAVGLPPPPAAHTAAVGTGNSSSRGASHTVDEASVAVELLLPAHSVQQLLAAGQESLRAIVLSCTPGRLLGHVLLDKAWKLQQDGADADQADAAAAAGSGATDGPDAASGFGVVAAAAGYEMSDAKSLQLQLRITREKPPQQPQQGPAGTADGPAAATAGAPALKIDGEVGAEGSPASCLSECQMLSVVLMTAPAAAEPATHHPQDRLRQPATQTAAAAAAAELRESGEGDVMLAQLPLLVLPAGAQAELQRLFAAAEAAGVPYAAMYRQLLPLLQDWELLLTLWEAAGDSSRSDGSGGGGNGSAIDSRDGGCDRDDRNAAGFDGSRGAASGRISVDGGGKKDGGDEVCGMGHKGSGRAALSEDGSSGSSDGDNSGWGSGDGGSDGRAIDVGQLKAAAAALAAYFAAHGMPECLQLVQAIEQQLEL